MATDLGQSRITPATKNETIVTTQLARAERRIRNLDLTTALLGFVAGTIAYAVVMSLCDRWLNLSDWSRQLAFALYVVAAGVYLGLTVVLPFRRQVNPYYAARRVEQTLPGAKNSVVNWLDLRDVDVPPVIRGALGQRAAKDLGRADLDQAISGQRAKWSGYLASGMAVVMFFLIFYYGSGPFFFRLGRIFAPFAFGGAVPTWTQLTLIQPPEGDLTVTVGRPIHIVVRVDGKVPNSKKADALKLLFHYHEDEPSQERLFVPDSGREWSVIVPAIDVQSGFWYRITGGDAATPEYRVNVRSTPLITGFLATYQFPAYTARPEAVRRERKLEGLIGTKVVLKVRTNRPLQDAGLDFDVKDGREKLKGERLADEPNAFRVIFPLEQSGHYRLRFTATDGETYTDPLAYPVVVIPDLPPKVELTKPGKNVELPANGVLQIEGQATDDVGVKSLTLRMSLLGGIRLQPKNYRSDDKIRLPHGGYPTSLAYKDFVDLAKLQDSDGKPIKLEPGNILEYWLEASDACDQPRPNVVESKHFRVRIVESAKDEKQQQQDRQQAQQEQKDHEKTQDQQLQQEDKDRQEAAGQQQEQNKEETAKDQQPKDGGSDPNAGEKSKSSKDKNSTDDKKGKADDGKEDEKQDNGSKADNQPDATQQKKDDQLKEQTQRLQDAIKKAEEQQKSDEQKGEGKGDPKPGDGSAKGEGQPDQSPKPGEAKPEGKPDSKNESGKGKEGPKPGDKQEKPSEGKGDGATGPKQDSKADTKGGSPMKGNGEGKDEGSPSQPKTPAEAKGGGSQDAQKNAGNEKPEPQSASKEQGAKAESKDAGPEGKTADGRPAGEKKESPPPPEKSEAKGAGEKAVKNDDKAVPKGDKSGTEGQRAEGKPDSQKGEKDVARAEAKADKAQPDAGDKGGKTKPEQVTPRDVERIAKDLNSDDAQKRKEAAEQLEQAKDRARNAEARELARQELEKHGNNASDNKTENPKPEQVTPRDVERMAKDLKSDDASKRAEAQKQLEKAMEQARDTQAREAARKELEKNGQANDDNQIAKSKPMTTPEGKKSEKPAEAKEGAGEQKEEPAVAKTLQPKDEGKQGEAKDGGKQQKQDQPAEAKDVGKGMQKVPTGRRTDDEISGDVEPPVQPSKPKDHRDAVIQLEDIRKKINKDVLKAANMTEAEYREWEKAARELNKRLQTEVKLEDAPAAPQTGNGLTTGSQKRTDPGAKGQPGDSRNAGAVLAPPDYRDGWHEFTTRKKKNTDSKEKP